MTMDERTTEVAPVPTRAPSGSRRPWVVLSVVSVAANVAFCATRPVPVVFYDSRDSPEGWYTARTGVREDKNPLTSDDRQSVTFEIYRKNAPAAPAAIRAEVTPGRAAVYREMKPDVSWTPDGKAVQLRFDTGEVSLHLPPP